jgi:hypothetical protein
MANIIADLAAKVGVSQEQIEKAMGAVLQFLKEKLPEDAFAKVHGAVPNADTMMEAANAADEGGGLFDSIKGAVDKLVGGGGATGVMAKLSQLGFSMEQLQKFAAGTLEFFKKKLPPDVLEKLKDHLPVR